MCSEHVHRLVVIDDSSRPIGVLTSLDLTGKRVSDFGIGTGCITV